MKLLCITDLHGGRIALRRILDRESEYDVLLLGGDLTNFGRPEQAAEIVRACQRPGRSVFAVAGNCDSSEIDRRLVECGVSLFGRGAVHGGVGFYGVSAMPPWRGDMYELTEDEIAAALWAGKQAIGDVSHEVVLAHPPPRGCAVDHTAGGAHVGSTALRAFIDEVQPALVVCGHIHEARGVDHIGRTTVVNCGYGNAGSYAVADVGGSLRVDLRRV